MSHRRTPQLQITKGQECAPVIGLAEEPRDAGPQRMQEEVTTSRGRIHDKSAVLCSHPEASSYRCAQWTPTANKARLSALESLAALPRRPWGIYAGARAQMASLVARVERGRLAPDAAADHFRSLAARLVRHREAVAMVREGARSHSLLAAGSGMP